MARAARVRVPALAACRGQAELVVGSAVAVARAARGFAGAGVSCVGAREEEAACSVWGGDGAGEQEGVRGGGEGGGEEGEEEEGG